MSPETDPPDEYPRAEDRAFVLLSTPEDRRVEAARARLKRAQRRTRGTLVALRSELLAQTDRRTWYRAQPGAALFSAFLFGLYLGSRR
jgi:hypothetical protein